MSFAFGHLIFPWILGKIYEFVSKKKISHYTWFFLLLGGILPDTDFLLDWTLGTDLHRTFTHSFFFIILISLLVYFIFFKNKLNQSYAIAIAVGISAHLIADMILNPGVPLLWPSLLHYYFFGKGYLAANSPTLLNGSKEMMTGVIKSAVFDMALGTTWIFYLWFRKRIKF